MTTKDLLLREELIDFAEWISKQEELDVFTVDEAVDKYLEQKVQDAPLSPATTLSLRAKCTCHGGPHGGYTCPGCRG